MADEVDDYQRFLSGAMSPREESVFRQRIEAVGGELEMLEGLRNALRSQESARPGDLAASWQDLQGRIAHRGQPTLPRQAGRVAARSSTASRRQAQRTLGFGIAAAAVLLVCFTVARKQFVFASHTREVPIVTLLASKGDGLRRALLPDSTRVTLAPDSHLSYPADYGHKGRDVTLTGRAEFQVRHDPAHPFRVHVRDALLEDLGTRFTVTAYAGAPILRVAVAEGSVDVRRGSASSATILSAGLVAQLDPLHDTITVRIADQDLDFGWTSGTLSFHGVRLTEIAAQLSHNYARPITVANSVLANRRLEVSFTLEETGEQACQTLAILTHSRCDQTGPALELSPLRSGRQ